MSKDFIELKIDVDRMTNGKAVAKRLRKTDGGGIPWMVILNSEGQALINSDGPKGNIGCPVSPAEVAHFKKMIRTARRSMTDQDLAIVEEHLDASAQKIRAAQAKSRSQG